MADNKNSTNTDEWNRKIANVIGNKLKGIDVPESYTNKDCEDILKRYWHRAMESE